MQQERSKKSLKPGMNSITKNFFVSVEDLSKLIETCAKSGVSEFAFGELKIQFGRTPAPGPAIPDQAPENVILEQKQVEESALLKEEILTKEEQIAELLISDPLSAEELMAEGVLEEDSEDQEGLGDDE